MYGSGLFLKGFLHYNYNSFFKATKILRYFLADLNIDFSSISAYESLDIVREADAWIDDGLNQQQRPGWTPGYKGGWTMRVVRNRCTGEEIRREYKECEDLIHF